MSGDPFFYTWSKQDDVTPIEMSGGEGIYFFDTSGNKWLDFGSLSYQANLGHGNERMAKAIAGQAASLSLAMPNASFPAKKNLAEKLLELAPDGFSRVFFTLGGAEANENAIKMARLFTKRQKLVSRYRSYHGATMGALALTGDWRRPALELQPKQDPHRRRKAEH